MKTLKSLVFWKFKGVEKGNIYLIWINLLPTYHFFYLIRGVIRKNFSSVIEEKWIVTTRNRKWRHGKEANSTRIYIHSRNLKIHKNFSYLKLSHIKYASVLLKQGVSKDGGSVISFNFLIVVGVLTLIFFNTECWRV